MTGAYVRKSQIMINSLKAVDVSASFDSLLVL